VRTATIEFLKIKLLEDGLYFRGSIPDDGNSILCELVFQQTTVILIGSNCAPLSVD
jgi:hypothetical protein